MRQDHWAAIEARLIAVGRGHWHVVMTPDESISVRINDPDGRESVLRVTREERPASAADVRFIGHVPEDLRRLLNHLRARVEVSLEQLDEIEDRVRHASLGPWRAFLKSKGGVGGDSVIWITERDDEPDLYLWINEEPAPDSYYDLVGCAHQDLLELLRVIRTGAPDDGE